MRWTTEEVERLRTLSETTSISDIADELGRSYDSVRKKLKQLNPTEKPVSEQVHDDRRLLKAKTEGRVTNKKYKEALLEIERLRADNDAILRIKETPQAVSFSKRSNGGSDAVAFIIASDWRSISNRDSTSSLSMPSLISFSATFRCTGSSCSASYTSPMPPAPILLTSR